MKAPLTMVPVAVLVSRSNSKAIATSAFKRPPRNPRHPNRTMHAARKASRASLGVFKLWTTDAGTFPVLFCAGVAAVGCTLTAVRAIRMSPDVRIDKDKRRNAMSFTEDNGAEWRAKRFRYANYDRNPINQSHQFDDLYSKEENKEVAR